MEKTGLSPETFNVLDGGIDGVSEAAEAFGERMSCGGKFHDWLDDSSCHPQVMESRIHHDVIDRVH